MINVDQLLGRTPALRPSATRTIQREKEPASPALRASAANARTIRSTAVASRIVALLRGHYTTRVFCHHHVIRERLDGHKLGKSGLRRVIDQMIEFGELKLVHTCGSQRYYAFASNPNPDLSQIDTRQRAEQKAKRITSANLLCHWPQAKKGFTHYQLKNYLGSDQFAAHAIHDLLATGEISGTTMPYGAGHRTVYTLNEAKS